MNIKPKILIVDNDQNNLKSKSRLLQKTGYQVFAADSGKSGMELVWSQKPDLVLLDIALPDINGIKICKQIKADPVLGDVSVMLISGKGTAAETFEKAVATGAEYVIRRPIPNRELVAQIDTILQMINTEKLHSTILNTISDAVYFTDEQGDFTFVCQNGEAIFGYSQPEVEELENIFKLIPHLNRSILETEKEVENIELEITTKTGEKKTVLVSSKPVSIGRGRFLFTVRDISERVHAEKSYWQSEEQLRFISEHIREVLYLYDPDADKFLYVSPAYEKIWQQPVQVVYDDPLAFTYLVHPDDQPAFYEAVRKEHEDGEYFNLEYRIVRPDGTTRWIWSRNFPTKDGNEQFRYTVGISEDITERIQADESLQESEQKYRLTLDALTDAIHVVDANLDIILHNKTARQRMSSLGIKTELLGQNLFNAFPFLSEKIQAEYQQVLASGELLFTEEHFEIEGHSKYSEIRKVPIFKKGQVSEVVTAIRDTTNRKQMEEELRESEEKYRALYDNAPLAYQSLDEDGNFKDINPTWLQTLGYERDEIIGAYFADFLHPTLKNDFKRKFAAFKKRGFVHNVQYKIRHKQGHYLDISFEGCIGYHPDGSFKQTYCVFQDITERKKVADALRANEEFLETIYKNSDIGVFVVNVTETGQYVYAGINPTHERLTGVTNAEIVGKTPRDLVEHLGQESVDYIYGLYDECCAQKRRIESEFYAPEGSVQGWWLSRLTPIIDENDRVVKLIGSGIITTDLKETQQALENTNIFLEEAQKVGQIGSWDWNFKTNIAYWSDGLFDVYGRDKLLGVPSLENDQWLEPIFSEDRQHFQKTIQTALEQKTDYECEYRITRENDGQIRSILARGKILCDPSGETERLVGSAQDITERVQAEEEREHLLAQVIQGANELEKRVQERTEQYQTIIDLTADREIRMAELKQVIKKLRQQLIAAGLDPVANDTLAEWTGF
jgi:PAS domain S-box-containing protein